MAVRYVTALLVCFCALHYACAARYALLVGNNTGRGNYAPLKYVENDLNALHGILTDFCGFDKRDIFTLYNGAPADLDRLLSDYAGRIAQTQNNMFLFYYSGHADVASLKMGGSEYPLTALKEKLSAFPSDVRIGIFDACQSGSFTRIKGGKLDEPFLFRDDGKTKGQVILCSSSINENAQESDLYGNSVFTFHFINALRGSADVNTDGRVTLSEAYQYAYNHTLATTAGSSGGVQHPSYQFRIQGEGDIILADLNVRSRGILLDRHLGGEITIFNDQGGAVADLTKEKNTAVMIALNPGTYRIVNTQGESRTQASATIGRNSPIAVAKPQDFSPIAPASSSRKGAASLRLSQIGITVAGTNDVIDFSPLVSGLNKRFESYRYFSMTPSFSFPSSVRHFNFSGQIVDREGLLGNLGFGSFKVSAAADHSGSRLNALDSTAYGSSLHTSSDLSIFAADIGAGFRFPRGFARNMSLIAGLNVYRVNVKVSSVFIDSLYNVQAAGSETYEGTIMVPYICGGYTWPVMRFCDVGATLRYRYQRRPGEINRKNPEEQSASSYLSGQGAAPLLFNFRGFDFGFFVNVNLKFGKME